MLKFLLNDSLVSPLWKLVTWISASLNHCKVKRVDPSRLISWKATENLEFLIVDISVVTRTTLWSRRGRSAPQSPRMEVGKGTKLHKWNSTSSCQTSGTAALRQHRRLPFSNNPTPKHEQRPIVMEPPQIFGCHHVTESSCYTTNYYPFEL